jgi:hypothetical protein
MKFNELSIIYNSFLFLGLLFAVISVFISGSSVYMINILSSSCLIAGLILIIGQMMIVLNKTVNESTSPLGFLGIFNLMKTNIGPFVCVLAILGFLLYLNIQFKDKIGSGHLPDEFYLFTNLNILVICAQAFIFFSGMQKKKDSNIEFLPLTYSTFLYLLCLININLVIIQYNILRYFTTDG